MAIFCTKCGTKNEIDAAFCDNCGAPLKPPGAVSIGGLVLPTASLKGAGSVPGGVPAGSRKTIYAGAMVCSVLIACTAAMYFVLQPPAASRTNLLAAAKAGYGVALAAQSRHELCLTNIDYSNDTLNIREYDGNSQAWLNVLVVAGLYNPPVAVNSGGFFSSTLQQYVAMPELSKYREGKRLCVAKNIEITDVVEIEKPLETSSRGSDSASKLLTVRAKLVVEATSIAPWLEKLEVRDAVLEKINGWDYKNKKLQKQVDDTFGLRDRQWVTGPVYKAELEKQYRMAQRSESRVDRANKTGQQSESFSVASMLSDIFSFGGHPLKGTWRMDKEGKEQFFGIDLAGVLGTNATMTFTSNSIDVGGQSVKCKFEVNGKQVKVIPEGWAESFAFTMQDKNTALLDLGMMKMRYKRVE